MSTIQDALSKAFAAEGKPLEEISEPIKKPRVIAARNQRGQKGQKRLVVITYGATSGKKFQKPKTHPDSPVAAASATPPTQQAVVVKSKTVAVAPKATPLATSLVPKPSGLTVEPGARCMLALERENSSALLPIEEGLGRYESLHQQAAADVRELTLGLDFGTSSVKVIIGDHASDIAYAVPFLKAGGVDAYLLPSRLYEGLVDSEAVFSLAPLMVSHRDLKLGLLGDPESAEKQEHVIAFIAMVILRSRAWLFQEHGDIYRSIKCLWRIRVGLPAATALGNRYVPLLERLVHAAWQVASETEAPSLVKVAQAKRMNEHLNGTESGLEVQVIPEIAAQIYGFVSSSSFDPKAPNRFLIVDVGAGTVDSCLFQVKAGKGGRWNFEFYTAVVQPYGVSNLHASRIDWWLENLALSDGSIGLVEELKASKFATDLGFRLPEKTEDYVSGVKLNSLDPNANDRRFFREKLMTQVQGSTLWRAWNDGYLAQSQLTHTPMFLCGGGARSSFYLALETALIQKPNFSWLSAEAWSLGFPSDLVCEGVPAESFDRLSVAYGLSKLEVGQIVKALPLSKVKEPPPDSFGDRYIDKDQC